MFIMLSTFVIVVKIWWVSERRSVRIPDKKHHWDNEPVTTETSVDTPRAGLLKWFNESYNTLTQLSAVLIVIPSLCWMKLIQSEGSHKTLLYDVTIAVYNCVCVYNIWYLICGDSEAVPCLVLASWHQTAGGWHWAQSESVRRCRLSELECPILLRETGTSLTATADHRAANTMQKLQWAPAVCRKWYVLAIIAKCIWSIKPLNTWLWSYRIAAGENGCHYTKICWFIDNIDVKWWWASSCHRLRRWGSGMWIRSKTSWLG